VGPCRRLYENRSLCWPYFRVWDQCNVVQDYLTVHDGDNSSAPVLVRLCGGDSVPEIVSSGPTMLLEFHTSPFDSPYHPAPLSYLPGFELEVQVSNYVDSANSIIHLNIITIKALTFIFCTRVTS